MGRALDSGWARGVSLASALALMFLVTVFPRGLTDTDGSPISHGVLTLIMWGLPAGFVHGVGFVPRNNVLRVLLGPVVAWLWMGGGNGFLWPVFFEVIGCGPDPPLVQPGRTGVQTVSSAGTGPLSPRQTAAQTVR